MKYVTPFAACFKKLRNKIGVSQKEMAEMLGVTQQSISFYEKGERLPDFYILQQICEVTGCSIQYLFGYQESMSDINEKIYQDLGLSDNAVAVIRNITLGEKAILNRLLESDSFYALIACIRYAETVFELDADDPLCLSFDWDHRAYMCSRIFDDVMDELFDSLIREQPKEQQEKYFKKIDAEMLDRQNTGVWRKKEKLPVAVFDKPPKNYLEKFKYFKVMMQNIENENK